MGVAAVLRSHVPVGSLPSALRKAASDPAALRAQRAQHGLFLLNTMRKTGSHYLMSIVANYLWFAVLHGNERLDYVAMKEEIWNQPASRASVARLRRATGYAGWRWEHENPLIRFSTARTIVHTYRNPLDTFVSRYHYLYVNRTSPPKLTVRAAIDAEVSAFAWHYVTVRAIARRPNVLRVSYERLVREPNDTATEVLTFAGLEPDADALARAIECSSTEHVVADEQRHGLADANLVGGAASSFIRSGTIGEWKSFLTDDDRLQIERILARSRVSLDEFVLE